MVQRVPKCIRFVPDHFGSDNDFVMEAISKNVRVLDFRRDLTSDPDFLLKAIGANEQAVKWAPEDLKKQRAFTIAACEQNRLVMGHIDEEFKKDHGVLRAAWENDDASFEHAMNAPVEMLDIDI